MMLTHAPYDATPDSPDYIETKSGKGKGKAGGHFPDMVAYTDKLIGKLVAKLEELHLRDNTLLLILGDNGTGRGTPSRFQGRDVVGGKGTTTLWGTHVPAIGNWPGHFASGKVYTDLIDATDFLPTICEATGVPVQAEPKLDGRSFLPQLRGEKGAPRDWLYAWYNPSGGAKAKAEFAHDASYKLYTDGRFFAVAKDDLEKSRLADDMLDEAAKAAKAKLQAALKQFEGPRPAAFVKQSKAFGGETGEDPEGNKTPQGKGKGKQKAK
jgi:arylsulfatase A